MATYLILGATYAFAAAVQPGPFQAYLISQPLRKIEGPPPSGKPRLRPLVRARWRAAISPFSSK
jgi:hypothetical protein